MTLSTPNRGLEHPCSRDTLGRAIRDAQDGARSRVVVDGELADQVMTDWAILERMAASIGRRVQDLRPSGAWWFRATDDPHGREDEKVHTVVTVSSSGFRVDRKSAISHAHGGGPRGVSLHFRGSDDQTARAAAATEIRSEREAELLALVGRLQEQLAWRAGRLATLLQELEELPEARLEPEEVRDGVELAVQLLDELVNGRSCHVCGCTHHSPCETEAGPCGWAHSEVHADGTELLLCTACTGLVDAPVPDELDDVKGETARDGEE